MSQSTNHPNRDQSQLRQTREVAAGFAAQIYGGTGADATAVITAARDIFIWIQNGRTPDSAQPAKAG